MSRNQKSKILGEKLQYKIYQASNTAAAFLKLVFIYGATNSI
jgi:hypothetical protein